MFFYYKTLVYSFKMFLGVVSSLRTVISSNLSFSLQHIDVSIMPVINMLLIYRSHYLIAIIGTLSSQSQVDRALFRRVSSNSIARKHTYPKQRPEPK